MVGCNYPNRGICLKSTDSKIGLKAQHAVFIRTRELMWDNRWQVTLTCMRSPDCNRFGMSDVIRRGGKYNVRLAAVIVKQGTGPPKALPRWMHAGLN